MATGRRTAPDRAAPTLIVGVPFAGRSVVKSCRTSNELRPLPGAPTPVPATLFTETEGRLDLFELRRAGALVPGTGFTYRLTSRWGQRTGELAGRVLAAAGVPGRPAALLLSYRVTHPDGTVDDVVERVELVPVQFRYCTVYRGTGRGARGAIAGRCSCTS